MKALGVFIFCGSATLGVEAAGYDIDRVLELTNDMDKLNAYHFIKNRPNIPVVLPNQWENDDYLSNLVLEDYDLLYSNCPCSSLSQINRNASVDGDKNVHFYRVFNVVEKVKPKAFFIENAPTLVKLGYPIIKDMVNKLNHLYKFTIIRDYAGNHGVAMRRQRTLVVGWRKDVFKDSIPLLSMEAEPQVTTKDVIGHLYNYNVGDPNIPNHVLMGDRIWGSVENLFGYVPNESTTLLGFINRWSEVDPQLTDPICRKEVEKQIDRLNKGLRLWDKSPYRVSEDGYCPSLTSVTKIIHPVHNRTFTIREYASLMGYPMDFVFYPNECNVPTIQAIAQGVPKYFAKYIATEVKESLLNNRELISDSLDKVLSFQHNTYKTFQLYDLTGINNITSLIK